GLQTLTGNFTDHLLGKLLVVVDELAVNKEEYHPKWETLKNVTSMEALIVNGKHIRKFEINNLSYLFIFTNRPNAVFIEEKDRRIDFLACDNKKANDIDYFDALHDLCFNQDTGDHFFSWLVATNEFDDVNPRRKINNKPRLKAIQDC